MHSPKNQKMDMKKKIKYIRIWYQTDNTNEKERMNPYCLYTEVLNYSRAQRLLICSETLEAPTLHVTKHSDIRC